MATILFVVGLSTFFITGLYFASKVTPYDSEDYNCPSKVKGHTNRDDRDNKENR